MPLIYLWSKFFILTLMVESAICLPLLGPRHSIARRIAAATFAQLITHPIAFFAFPELQLPAPEYALLAETWAVAAEFVFYRLMFSDLTSRRALGLSALANAASYSVGLLLQ